MTVQVEATSFRTVRLDLCARVLSTRSLFPIAFKYPRRRHPNPSFAQVSQGRDQPSKL